MIKAKVARFKSKNERARSGTVAVKQAEDDIVKDKDGMFGKLDTEEAQVSVVDELDELVAIKVRNNS